MAQQGAQKKPVDIVLNAQLDMACAKALQERLLYGLKQGAQVRLRGGLVERIDTACIQVLASFFQTAQHQALPVAWLDLSAPLERALQRCGLADLLAPKETKK